MHAPLPALMLAPLLVATAAASPARATTDDTALAARVAALDECADSLDVAIFNSPKRPHARAPLRALVVSEPVPPADARIVVLDPKGRLHPAPTQRFGGPPYGFVAQVDKPTPGRWRLALVAGDQVLACQDARVGRGPSREKAVTPGEDPIWRSRIKWERDTENLYSLWVERLFAGAPDQDLSWKNLHEVLRERDRNLLHDHLGMGEDGAGKQGLALKPDCADFPYFLRAYFAWKLGLPFAYRGCRRGNAERAPTCGEPLSNHQSLEVPEDALTPPDPVDAVAAFERFARRNVGGTVHSSSLRTAPDDERSDFYPVRLDRRGLRPGTIFADPYGHTLMISQWIPQKDGESGWLIAADAQPDGIIGRRIFWKGSFLFPEDEAVKGAGWKRFRPVRATADGVVALSNDEIARSIDYGDYSTEQWSFGKDGFYDRMDALINPEPMTPDKALVATIDALDQQIRRRVESVDNGEQWKRANRGRAMDMPDGPAIFITSGPWEDYSTPSRDLRLLIAMDTVRDFPARVERLPERFVIPPGQTAADLRARLERLLADEVGARKITYTRSDGSPWTLTLGEVMQRGVAFELAYNPNDCVEVRWGAAEGSEERATCDHRAPEAQRKRMETYRAWFQKRERPAH